MIGYFSGWKRYSLPLGEGLEGRPLTETIPRPSLIALVQDTRATAGYMDRGDKAKLELGRRTVQLEQRDSSGACPRKALAFKFPARF